MANERERPYSAFNYLVDLGGGDGTAGPRAGFQEVTGLSIEVTMQEYRAGNDARSAPQKIPGMYSVPDVTLKRGVLGATDLTGWLEQVRRGEDARRDVTITLQSENRQSEAMTWLLKGAQPMKYTGPSLNGKGTDVAVEELVLSVEELVIE
ncbi:MAG TPA: phage tail protein [Anaerolineae bacterium]|nr:phage tail protein [Anaerolineae bacterium]